MVDSKIKEALQTLVPHSCVARLLYKGKANTFITFQLVLGQQIEFADDKSRGKEFIYRADIYSKRDYIALIEKTVDTLETLECYEISINPEVYEADTGYFHVPITFKIMEV